MIRGVDVGNHPFRIIHEVMTDEGPTGIVFNCADEEEAHDLIDLLEANPVPEGVVWTTQLQRYSHGMERYLNWPRRS